MSRIVSTLSFLMLLPGSTVLFGQKPVIFPGGVVNAASYTTGGPTGKAVAVGSIVSIFGEHLASTEQSAGGFPLPTTLGGTSVTLRGVAPLAAAPVFVAAPIFYVSPRQLNIQIPASIRSLPVGTDWRIVVTTLAGSSEPYPIDRYEGFRIFTQDSSGCGRGAILNVGRDGAASINSPSNSAAPGDFVSVFGTGLGVVFNEPPDGAATPLSLCHKINRTV